MADKLAAALNGLGLTEFGTEVRRSTRRGHEAVQQRGGDGSNRVIGHVMRIKGYKLGEYRYCSPAMVGVVDAVP